MREKNFLNVYQLTFLPGIFPINSFIYETKDSLLVIDIGTKYFVRHIQTLSKRLNKPIKSLILTHAHSDHVAGINEFKKAFPSAKTYMSNREYRFIKEGLIYDKNEVGYILKGDYSKVNFIVDHTLSEGDYIDDLKVISTPGHSIGSISLWDEKNKIIIAGDSFQTKGKVAVAGEKVVLFPFISFGTANKIEAIKSAKKILNLKPNYLAVGHGNYIKNPIRKMNKAIDRISI